MLKSLVGAAVSGALAIAFHAQCLIVLFWWRKR